MASAHKKTHISKTLSNLSYSLGKIRQLHTPQHTQDEAIDVVDRNKHFNHLETYLFIKQKKKTSETLQPGHRKTLGLSSRSAPTQ